MTGLAPCVVLAGGVGSRMRPATDQTPKPLLEVAGEPFLVHQLRWLTTQGVTDVVVSIGYLGHMIRDELSSRDLGCRVRFVDEGDDLLGTGGAVRRCLEEADLDDAFFVLYGDSYLNIDLAEVWAAFGKTRGGSAALMTVYRNDGRFDRSNVRLDGDRVGLYDKTVADPAAAGMHHIDYGVSVMSADAVRSYVPVGPSDLADALRTMSIEGRLAAYEAEHRFFEIGSPEGFVELEDHLAGRS